MKFTLFRDNDVPGVEKDIADDIINGAPRQHSQLMFASDQETVKSGIWESTAGTFHAIMQNQIEYCHILEGSATIRTEYGETFTVEAGDTFVMESGLRTKWTVHEYIKKHFVICST